MHNTGIGKAGYSELDGCFSSFTRSSARVVGRKGLLTPGSASALLLRDKSIISFPDDSDVSALTD